MRKPKKAKRGFAAMTKERQLEIARLGGQSVPPEKRTFSTNKALAKSAGSTGGLNVPASKRQYSINRELARESGRKGGLASRSV